MFFSPDTMALLQNLTSFDHILASQPVLDGILAELNEDALTAILNGR